MKFLDDAINKAVDLKISARIELANTRIKYLEEESLLTKDKIISLNREIYQLKEGYSIEIDSIKKEIKDIRAILNSSKEDLEIGLEGIIKIFNQKFDSLGYKKSIVTELLKKIAKLEDRNVLT